VRSCARSRTPVNSGIGRDAQGFAAGELEFRDGGDDAIVVVSHPREVGGPDWPAETATVIRFRDDRFVEMQD
jgi:hypothetical protein